MAKLPTIKRVSREDMKEAPNWIERLLTPLNQFMEATYIALSRNLTFQENIASQIREIEFTTASDYVANKTFTALTFNHSLKQRPFGCFLVQIYDKASYTPPVGAISLGWVEVNGVININYVSGLDDSKTYVMRVLVI